MASKFSSWAILAVSLIVTRTTQLNFPVALDCLAQIETAGVVKDGYHHEKGPYQIKPVTWARWSRQPFTVAEVDCYETQRVVKCELERIMKALEDRNIRPTPELIYLAWGAGLEGMLEHKTTWKQRDASTRFGRLYRYSVSESSSSGTSP